MGARSREQEPWHLICTSQTSPSSCCGQDSRALRIPASPHRTPAPHLQYLQNNHRWGTNPLPAWCPRSPDPRTMLLVWGGWWRPAAEALLDARGWLTHRAGRSPRSYDCLLPPATLLSLPWDSGKASHQGHSYAAQSPKFNAALPLG